VAGVNVGALLLVSLSLGLSNFAAAIGIGLSGVDTRTRLKTGLAFGFFEAAMPIIGLLVGRELAGHLGDVGRYAGGALLVLTGLCVLWQGHRGRKQQATGEQPSGHASQMSTGHLLLTGFALSLDNLVVGFALSFSQTPIALAAGVIAAVSIVLSLIGLELGERLGEHLGRWSEEIGAGVLILVGIALGTGVLG
jgi:putative Mn2+ efflux pump MntP